MHDFKIMKKQELQELAKGIADELAYTQKETLTTAEAAKYLGISQSYLYKLTADKAIPFYKPTGKQIYFDRKELDGWLKRYRIPTTEEAETAANDFIEEGGIL